MLISAWIFCSQALEAVQFKLFQAFVGAPPYRPDAARTKTCMRLSLIMASTLASSASIPAAHAFAGTSFLDGAKLYQKTTTTG